ncbi:MAG TPA: primosomal protein N' [Candidatus Binataceae bacterium]|nr:primosomal protein N' [Candidatus Binataceae bacterium]
MLAQVVIVGAGAVERLTYAVPASMSGKVARGHRVLVPLRSRRVTAIVTEVGEHLDAGGATPKPLLELLEPRPLFDRAHIELIEFMARYYMAPIGEAFRSVIPAAARVESRRMFRLTAAPNPLALATFTPLEHSIVSGLTKRPMTSRQLERLGEHREVEAALARLAAEGCIALREATRGRHREQIAPMVRLTADSTASGFRSSRQKAIAERLANAIPAGLRLDHLEAEIPGAKTALRAMAARGIVEIVPQDFASSDASEANSQLSGQQAPKIPNCSANGGHPIDLTLEQAAAVDAAALAVRSRRFETFLLWGITASGKTEVYMRLAAEALTNGRQVLVLVPEIALADQVVHSFRQRFGPLVALAHSAQNVAERWSNWMAALSGDARVVIGPRSAIFAPIHDAGLVVVDEEHDSAYKQEEGIRYNARDLAVALGRFGNCPVVLGSATPSAESYANAQRGRYRMLRLSRRVLERELAEVEIIDLRRYPSAAEKAAPEEPSDDSRTEAVPLSRPLLEALSRNMAEHGQSLVFLNRRGYHNFLQCHLCGTVITCLNCSVSMTFHMRGRTLRCHYCGASASAPERCFECRGYGLEGQGFGTERLVHALAGILPQARIERLDSDTSGRRGARSAILQGLRRGEVDILVGTQMITKGFDFPGVTLVAVVLADLALNMPDFRSAERTFQLLTQVAGRAGRGERRGRVLIQTYAPHHYSIRAAGDQDYARFVRRELDLRRELMYPPFARLALVRIEGEDGPRVSETAARAAALLSHAAKAETTRVLGPAPAPIERIKRRYRWQVMLKSQGLGALRAALAAMRAEVTPEAERFGVRLAIDIDPINML